MAVSIMIDCKTDSIPCGGSDLPRRHNAQTGLMWLKYETGNSFQYWAEVMYVVTFPSATYLHDYGISFNTGAPLPYINNECFKIM
jgi:hypothetical protein